MNCSAIISREDVFSSAPMDHVRRGSFVGGFLAKLRYLRSFSIEACRNDVDSARPFPLPRSAAALLRGWPDRIALIECLHETIAAPAPADARPQLARPAPEKGEVHKNV